MEALADSLKRPPARPREKEVVVTQTLGMKRWVSLELARLLGICANVEFSLPRRFVQGLLKKTGTAPFGDDVPEPLAWTWKIMRLLASPSREEGFGTPADYLSDGDDVKRFQLAALLADTFDQYSIYRPEMVLDWESGKDNHWQARNWGHLE